ncbi:glycosyl transferase family 2 [Halalkaliarchaeum desulfuricum]|uniref:Glycosyl transferase family 2 n=1 Tax=Halalkaliarchaeum desulfuricum TaxID=2055893 RepID=A0A343THY5_9EURY|nr:lysylphosphatidylglycerol synthase transmembrane domain-containing protein [Halalkaliarchaeum desulfuricum]AUX08707.1 glycosyl transferase family 2 [Halalkaliarchaeum desulfuricum]
MKGRALVAFAIAIGLLGLFVYAIGWNEVLSAISRTTPSVYATAFLAMIGCLFFRSLVWHRVLSIVDEARPYWLVAGVFLTAMFAKYAVPYGQVTSGVGIAAVISRYFDAAYEEGLAAIVSADFLNYVPYYTLGGVGVGYVLFTHPLPIDLGAHALPVVALVALVATVLWIGWQRRTLVVRGMAGVTARIRALVRRLTGRNVGFLRRENVERRFEGFYTTLDLVGRDRRGVLGAIVFAHLGWTGLAVALFATAHAVGTEIPLGIAFLAVAVSKVGFLVPTPGGVGGVEASMATALYLLWPVGFATATATALLWRLSTYWFTILVGGTTAMAMTLRDPTSAGTE